MNAAEKIPSSRTTPIRTVITALTWALPGWLETSKIVRRLNWAIVAARHGGSENNGVGNRAF